MFIVVVQVRAQAQDKTLFEKAIFVSKQGDSLRYRILYPENFESTKKYPLVLFMHGAGERGNDNEKQLTHGADLFLSPANRKQFPCIVIFPQCQEDKYWVDINLRKKLLSKEVDLGFEEVDAPPTREMELVMELHNTLKRKKYVDKKRLYITGLSMGGFGTFEIVTRWPKTFAGAVAMCGGGNPDRVERYAKTTPIWITHGMLDNVVDVKYSRRVYEALQKAGGTVKYTEFPEANHNAWDPTFAMPDLLPWLFAQHR
ncbi:MAG: prolyl oligopeptidase family serine peptidase [Bacteroidia bacterium]|nr:prolyl oligopeptidase family serine peptidase [Bacteroidia bacterium]